MVCHLQHEVSGTIIACAFIEAGRNCNLLKTIVSNFSENYQIWVYKVYGTWKGTKSFRKNPLTYNPSGIKLW